MLEECVDYLELATKQLKTKIQQLEEKESKMLFTQHLNSTDCE